MKRLAILAIICLAASPLFAGEAQPWKLSVDANLTFTQNNYSDNWAGGEAGAISWAFNSNSLAEKQLSSKLFNKNTLKLLFGQTHNQDAESNRWSKPVKSTDLVDFESVMRFTLGAWVDPYVGARIETQFYDAGDITNKRYLNPATFTESAGIARVFIKEEKREWNARLGAGIRQHVNRDVYDPVADTKETFTSTDGGLVFDSEFKTSMSGDKIGFSSKLTVYKALAYSKKDDFAGTEREDYWKAPDVNWENIFTASITKYLMVNLYIQLLYDKEIDLGGRFKETMALGLTYKFI